MTRRGKTDIDFHDWNRDPYTPATPPSFLRMMLGKSGIEIKGKAKKN